MTIPPPPEAPFHEVLTHAIQRRNLTLERLSVRLRAQGTPVSIATLSYWQSGRSVPTRARSLQAVEHLERILSLPPGYLMSALPGDSSSRWDPLAVLPPNERVVAVLDEMGLDLNRHSTTLVMHDSIRVAATARTHRQTTRQLIRAEHDGLWHTPVVLLSDGSYDPPGLEAGTGCSLGQMAVLEDISAIVAEIVLPRPLYAGDMLLFEYSALREEVMSSHGWYGRQLASSIESLVMEVNLDGPPPVLAEYHYRARDDVPPEQATRTALPLSSQLQMALTDVESGVHSITWNLESDHVPGLTRDPDQMLPV